MESLKDLANAPVGKLKDQLVMTERALAMPQLQNECDQRVVFGYMVDVQALINQKIRVNQTP